MQHVILNSYSEKNIIRKYYYDVLEKEFRFLFHYVKNIILIDIILGSCRVYLPHVCSCPDAVYPIAVRDEQLLEKINYRL